MHPQTLISLIESTAPPHLAASWDNSGIQIASAVTEIATMCVALDPTEDTVRHAVDLGAQFLLCHHPVTLSPTLPNRIDGYHRVLTLCLGNTLCLYSAHTSLDANPSGPAHWLGQALNLEDITVLEVTHREHPVLVKVHGTLNSALPEKTRIDLVSGWSEFALWPEELQTYRPLLRTATGDGRIYEQSLTAPSREFGFGGIGILPKPLSWPEFAAKLKPLVGSSFRCVGSAPNQITTVAYCPGSGADLAKLAFARGAHVFLTGDVKYHQAQDVLDQGLTIDVGHFCLEETMMRVWSQKLEHELASEKVRVIFLPGRDPFA